MHLSLLPSEVSKLTRERRAGEEHWLLQQLDLGGQRKAKIHSLHSTKDRDKTKCEQAA